MTPFSRYHRRARWPNESSQLFVGLLVALALIGVALVMQTWLLLPVAALILVAVAVWYAAIDWANKRLYAPQKSADLLWQLAQCSPQSSLLYVDLGLRHTPIYLSTHLLRGELIIVDLYNPQWFDDPALSQLRHLAIQEAPIPLSDPRTNWVNGLPTLLPVPDQHVPVVIFDQLFSSLVEPHDAVRLLAEAQRVLRDGGKLLIIERVETPQNRWATFLLSLGAQEETIWRKSWDVGRFFYLGEHKINGLLTIFALEKPISPPHQLHFEF